MKKTTRIHQQSNSNHIKLYVYNFVLSLHLFSAVLIPFYLEWAGISLQEMLLLQSLFTFFTFLLEIPTGVVADLYGEKKSLVLGGIIGAVGFFVYPLKASFLWFVLGEFLIALSLALRSGANESLLYNSSGSNSKFSEQISRLNSLMMLAMLFGPLIGALLVHWFKPQQIMFLQGITGVLAAIMALLISEPIKDKKNQSKVSETTRVWDTLLVGWQFLANQRGMWILALDMAVVAGVARMMIWLYQARLTDLVAIDWFGYIISIAVLLEIVAMNIYGRVAKIKKWRHELIFWSTVIPAIGFILAGVSANIWLILLGIWLSIGLGMSRKPFFSVLFNEQISASQRATILSTIAMTSQLVLTLLNPVVGWAADRSVSLTLMWLGALLIVFSLFSRVQIKHQLKIEN